MSIVMLLAACSTEPGGADADPVVVDNAVAFIKRPLAFDNNGNALSDDLRSPQAFRPGAVLYLKDRATPAAATRDISSAAFAGAEFLNDAGQLLYDVKDLEVSYDGTKLIFALRAPELEDADEDEQPTWNIWIYDLEQSALRRVITSDVTAEAGQDVAPTFLPDGRILFSSTRQRRAKAILLDEGKPQFAAQDERLQEDALVLHVMNDDGSNIEQLTFNQSHDLDPIVLDNGKILFSRWDNAGQTRNNGMNLYQINPDGSGLSYLFGRHSHASGDEGDTVHYAKPSVLENGNIAVQLREFTAGLSGGQATEVLINDFVEAELSIEHNPGTGQNPIVTGLSSSGEPGLKGSYGSFFPLYDGTHRYLVSWSLCRLVLAADAPNGQAESCTQQKLDSGDYVAANPLYGLWILDVAQNTQLPIVVPEEGQQYDEAVLLTSRPLPTYLPPATLSAGAQSLADEGYGILHIRSVYDVDGVDASGVGIRTLADPLQTPAANRSARFVRIEKAVSIPSAEVRDFDNSAFGRSRAQSMREILGYAPIEPDGSVKIAVPANVAFAISVLDQYGQRLSQRHQNWLQVAPGETVECIGCHDANSNVPHGRFDAQPVSVNTGATTTGLPFPNTEAALFADLGETMAETYARIHGVRRLTPDIHFVDEWTDALITPKAASFDYAYANLQSVTPISSGCAEDWSSPCRITINYEQHIHPLWQVERRVLDADLVTILADHTCIACHSEVDAEGATRVPAAQLDLTNGPASDEPDHFKSYRELLFNDNEQELVNGALADVLVASGQFEVDETGAQILDAEGNPIPILVTVPIQATMSTAGALASDEFLELFATGGSHQGYLTGAELKLIAEWLDLGAQYFNDPFAAPVN